MSNLSRTLAVALVVCAPAAAPAQATQDNNLGMGNPSGAVASTSYPDNYLMTKPQFALSYNRSRATPNWVSWHLSSVWLGSAPRQDNFRTDTALPSGWYRVGGSSYSGSGFDRGHMCPSADRTRNTTDNGATFLMTNMVPQAPNNNQQGWANLENFARSLAGQGKELYIVCGVTGQGGTGSNGYRTTIDSGRVVVPNKTWKVGLVMSNGSNDAGRTTSAYTTFAVIMPNDQSVGSDWRPYRTTVRNVENQTGYNFFSNLPQSVQDTIETRFGDY